MRTDLRGAHAPTRIHASCKLTYALLAARVPAKPVIDAIVDTLLTDAVAAVGLEHEALGFIPKGALDCCTSVQLTEYDTRSSSATAPPAERLSPTMSDDGGGCSRLKAAALVMAAEGGGTPSPSPAQAMRPPPLRLVLARPKALAPRHGDLFEDSDEEEAAAVDDAAQMTLAPPRPPDDASALLLRSAALRSPLRAASHSSPLPTPAKVGSVARASTAASSEDEEAAALSLATQAAELSGMETDSARLGVEITRGDAFLAFLSALPCLLPSTATAKAGDGIGAVAACQPAGGKRSHSDMFDAQTRAQTQVR